MQYRDLEKEGRPEGLKTKVVGFILLARPENLVFTVPFISLLDIKCKGCEGFFYIIVETAPFGQHLHGFMEAP